MRQETERASRVVISLLKQEGWNSLTGSSASSYYNFNSTYNTLFFNKHLYTSGKKWFYDVVNWRYTNLLKRILRNKHGESLNENLYPSSSIS